MHPIKTTLSNPKVIENVIDRYIESLKLEKKSSLKLKKILENKENWIETLTKQLEKETFTFSQPKQKRLWISSRKKILFTYNLEDMIVLKALLFAIAPTFAKDCSPNLYSYIRNRSVRQPIKKFCHYINKKIPNNKTGIWVYKTDLHHYYETIPVHSKSILWPKIDRILQLIDHTKKIPEYFKNLIIQSIRPEYETINNSQASNLIGIPYGSPISGLIGNLYCEDLDQISNDYPDAFYARYGDDILIAHPDRETLSNIVKKVNKKIDQLFLIRNPSKEKYIFFSKSGRPPIDVGQLKFKGSNTVNYLGCVIHANGKTHSTARKVNHLLARVNCITQDALKEDSKDLLNEKGRKVCQMLKQKLLFPENKILIHLFLKTNDHNFLANLDLRIAEIVASAITGLRKGRAFRRISYQLIRSEFGLPSLCLLRTQAEKLIRKLL